MANEIFLLNISGQDKPGLTSNLTSVLAEYDAKILDEARKYHSMEKEDQREYEKRLIEEGRSFELEKIIRAEEFQKDLMKEERELEKRYTEKDFIEVYEGDTLQAKNRANFENSKLKTTFIEKFGSNFDGFLNGPNDPQESTMIKKGNNKKIFFKIKNQNSLLTTLTL